MLYPHGYVWQWVAEDGMRMQGETGSQLWDAAFACQALLAAHTAIAKAEKMGEEGEEKEEGGGKIKGQGDKASEVRRVRRLRSLRAARAALRRGHNFVSLCQIRDNIDPALLYFRAAKHGAATGEARFGWPFNVPDASYMITDCTAEGIKLCRELQGAFATVSGSGKNKTESNGLDLPVPEHRLRGAAELLLRAHNTHRDGGFASYERQRGAPWYELLNPSEVSRCILFLLRHLPFFLAFILSFAHSFSFFLILSHSSSKVFGDIMIDYSYPECSSACLQALLLTAAEVRADGTTAAQSLASRCTTAA